MPVCVDKNITLMKIRKDKDEWASAKTSIKDGLEDCSHNIQHGKLVSTVSEIIHCIKLMSKTVVVESKYISNIRVSSCICIITGYCGWYILIL